MPRPTTKSALITLANEQFAKMWSLIDSIPADQQNADFQFGAEMGKEAHWGRDHNLRDVLIHLYEWHQLLLSWIQANQSGKAQPFLPAPYTWKTYGDMNVEFWKKHQNTSYSQAQKLVRASHAQVIVLIESFSDAELFTKAHFPWTGTTNLASYCISVTSSHYDWAIKKIKAHIKTLN